MSDAVDVLVGKVGGLQLNDAADEVSGSGFAHTLFDPPTSRHPECHLGDVPRYLFRAFDDASSGRSDDIVVASAMSEASPERSRVDLFRLPDDEAAAMLHAHLTKPLFRKKDAHKHDNLMSWSSSLAFVIQYAIYRWHNGNHSPGDITICAVDTTKFPRGQFARDTSLIRVYHDMYNLDIVNLGRLSFESRKSQVGSVSCTSGAKLVSAWYTAHASPPSPETKLLLLQEPTVAPNVTCHACAATSESRQKCRAFWRRPRPAYFEP